jgi:hypothetical protein
VFVAADYPFLDVLWTLLIFFAWVFWFWLIITVAVDIFRRKDASGWKKAAWLVVILFIPFIGVFAYLIVNSDEMADRNMQQAQAQQAQVDDYVRSVAGGSAAEIEKAKQLLDSGTITQSEFDAIKAKALA